MDRDEFFRVVAVRYNLDYTTTGGNDYYDMVRTFREGVLETLKRLPFLKARNATWQPGAVYVTDIHATWAEIRAIKRNSDGAPLVRVHREDIEEMKERNSTSVYGTTYYAYEEGFIYLWPTPEAAATFTVDYIPIVDASAFTTSTDPATYGISADHQNCVLEWMLMRAAEYQSNTAKAEYHHKAFDLAITESKREKNRKGGPRPQPRIGYPARRTSALGSRNDQYP